MTIDAAEIGGLAHLVLLRGTQDASWYRAEYAKAAANCLTNGAKVAKTPLSRFRVSVLRPRSTEGTSKIDKESPR